MSGASRGGRGGSCSPTWSARAGRVPRDELAEALWGESTACELGQGADGDRQQAARPARRAGRRRSRRLTPPSAATGSSCRKEAGSTCTSRETRRRRRRRRSLPATSSEARAAAGSAESLLRAPVPARGGRHVGRGEATRARRSPRARAVTCLTDACLRSGAAREAAKWAEETGRSLAVPRDGLPAADGGPRRRRQPGRGVARVRALPPAPRRRARRLPVAGDRVDLPRTPGGTPALGSSDAAGRRAVGRTR